MFLVFPFVAVQWVSSSQRGAYVAYNGMGRLFLGTILWGQDFLTFLCNAPGNHCLVGLLLWLDLGYEPGSGLSRDKTFWIFCCNAPDAPAVARASSSCVSACVLRPSARVCFVSPRPAPPFARNAPSPFFSPPSPSASRRLCRRLLPFVRGHAMASLASQRNATRAPPPPDQLASFHSLVDKCVNASVLCRHARVVELSAKAAEKGEALFGDDSLVLAHLRMQESMALASLAMEARGAEQNVLCRRSWGALLSVIAILQRRLADDTLLPGSVRNDETDYYAYQLAATAAAKELPVPSSPALKKMASYLGYSVLLDALYRSLNFL